MTHTLTLPQPWRLPRLLGLLAALVIPNEAMPDSGSHGRTRSFTVTATAYSSTPRQTDATPFHGAWGDRLDRLPEGQRAIAVSPDLLKKGLDRGKKVRIDGEDDTYVVLDRTPARWANRIDVYMGTDTRAARHWGHRKVKISWDGMTADLAGVEDGHGLDLDKPQRD